MDGRELAREVGRQRADRRELSRLALIWRGKPEAATTATAAECERRSRDPLRRFEPLRRRLEGTAAAALGGTR